MIEYLASIRVRDREKFLGVFFESLYLFLEVITLSVNVWVDLKSSSESEES